MLTKRIVYYGRDHVLACDGQCRKAWGVDARPRLYFDADRNVVAVREPEQSVGEPVDYDDYAFFSDAELGETSQPQSWEGGDGRPDQDDPNPAKMNRWCARQCERSTMVAPGEPIVLPDLSKRLYNKPS